MNNRKFYVANDNGEIICHDCDLGTAEAICTIMHSKEPEAGWEVLES